MSNAKYKKRKLDQFTFSSPWHFSDIVLVVEEQKFHVHKSTLSIWSKVFERMFTSDFKEKSSQEIPLPGKKAAEIKVLLTMIYDKEKSVNDNNLEILLKFADEYQMEKLTILCTNYMNTVLKKETAMHVYALARKFNLTSHFKKACMEHLEHWSMKQIEKNGHFSEFTIEEQLEIVCNKTKALEKYLLHDQSFRQKLLLSHINRNELISSCKICQSSPY